MKTLLTSYRRVTSHVRFSSDPMLLSDRAGKTYVRPCKPACISAVSISVEDSAQHRLETSEPQLLCFAASTLPADLLVIADAADEIADFGCEAHFRNWGRVGAWPSKQVADLGEFTFRLLRRSELLLAEGLAGGVLESPHIHLTNQLPGIRVVHRYELAVADVGAKWI